MTENRQRSPNRVHQGRHLELFQGQNDMLSNLYSCEVRYLGITFQSAEHAYQSFKAWHCARPNLANKIMNACTPMRAKQMAKEINITTHWTQIRVHILRQIVQAKYECNPNIFWYLRALPRDTIFAECTTSLIWSAGLPNKRMTALVHHTQWPGANLMGLMWKSTLALQTKQRSHDQRQEIIHEHMPRLNAIYSPSTQRHTTFTAKRITPRQSTCKHCHHPR